MIYKNTEYMQFEFEELKKYILCTNICLKREK